MSPKAPRKPMIIIVPNDERALRKLFLFLFYIFATLVLLIVYSLFERKPMWNVDTLQRSAVLVVEFKMPSKSVGTRHGTTVVSLWVWSLKHLQQTRRKPADDYCVGSTPVQSAVPFGLFSPLCLRLRSPCVPPPIPTHLFHIAMNRN